MNIYFFTLVSYNRHRKYQMHHVNENNYYLRLLKNVKYAPIITS